MASVRPIGSDEEHPLGLCVIRCHDVQGSLLSHVEEQRTGKWEIVGIVFNEFSRRERREHLGSGNPTFNNALKCMALPFNLSGTNGLSQCNAIQDHLPDQCPGLM